MELELELELVDVCDTDVALSKNMRSVLRNAILNEQLDESCK